MTDLTIWRAVAFGLVQGLGEFLPISSSAHLVILPWAAGWKDPGLAFDVALHIGTLVALLAFFWRDLWRLGEAFLRSVIERRVGEDVERRLAWLVLAASIPGALLGVLLERRAEDAFRAKWLVAAAMITMGLVLYLADHFTAQRRSMERITLRDALLIGMAQAMAIVPGVSRSGSTIAAGRTLGLNREGAARFSFFMAIPITAGAGLLKVPKLIRAGGLDVPLMVGMVVAGISGYLAIGVLLRLVRTRSYLPFVLYRIAFGALILALLASGLRAEG
ncbi:MAG TPA: undecaprenyl-diphosphatase UppP [Polyangia bacterium]|jgi:undecaprenyl-diphosphatase|nr:undecaprenyl-diphosphatase UppP [Polyangia bacterium]